MADYVNVLFKWLILLTASAFPIVTGQEGGGGGDGLDHLRHVHTGWSIWSDIWHLFGLDLG